uniref:Uncharacterized protein n=1 Tax=Avena sativa TaxID=4498 RepID=A0ACD5U0V5_AVESA
MRMAQMAAGRAHAALGARGVLSGRQRFLPSPDATTAAATVRFSTRRARGSRVVLCLAPGGGGERDEPAGSPWDGRLVDEGMDTLRRRIRQVRAESDPEEDEDQDEDGDVEDYGLLPGEWTELERRHHGSYVAGVRDVADILLALLLRARPGLGVGVLALLLLAVPATVLLVSAELIRALHSISAALLNGRM